VTQGATVGQTSSDLLGDQPERLAPLDEAVDHVRGPGSARLILEYGDYECPYSRQAYRVIQRLERRLEIRFAFRHFPLTAIHPHALAASCAAEAAAMQGRYWDMHEILFHRQKALEDEGLRGYAAELGLDRARFERDQVSAVVLQRIERDVRSGIASGEVRGTPTLFIDGLVHHGSLDREEITRALAGSTAEA
jgi:protein-disulfide isomerase